MMSNLGRKADPQLPLELTRTEESFQNSLDIFRHTAPITTAPRLKAITELSV